jgi:hypothetical protein
LRAGQVAARHMRGLSAFYRASEGAEQKGGRQSSMAWWTFNGTMVSSLDLAPRGRGNRGGSAGRGSGGRAEPQGAEAALGMAAAGRLGGGSAAPDRRRQMKEERAEWAT